MRYNTKLVEPAAAVDWGTFRREGDSYLRRLDVSDDVAIWLGAKLYLVNWERWRRGYRWNMRLARWETERGAMYSHRACLGMKMSDAWRQNLAESYAKARGLGPARWTAELESTLLSLRAQGLTYLEIGRKMGKTKAAIQARVRYLAFGRRLHKQAADVAADPT